MSRWLFKTEPTHYSYSDLERDKKTVWDGISNNLALKNLRMVKKGDEAFIYHTGDEKCLVGIVEITSDPYPDSKESDPRLVVVDVKPKGRLNRSVTLAEIKMDSKLRDFDLVRLPRLSVISVNDTQWERLIRLSK